MFLEINDDGRVLRFDAEVRRRMSVMTALASGVDVRDGVEPFRVPGSGLQPDLRNTTTTSTDLACSTLATPGFGSKDGGHLRILVRNLCVLILLSIGMSMPVEAQTNGIASVNSEVEINTSATNLCARANECGPGQQSSNGQRFVIVPERTNICQSGETTNCSTNFSSDWHEPSGSSSTWNPGNTGGDSYLIFANDDRSVSDRTDAIGQIVFDNEILGFFQDSVYTRSFTNVSKSGASYPSSSQNGINRRGLESFVFYSSSTSSSTSNGDWVSIGSDKRTLRLGTSNGNKGDYLRVITRSDPPTVQHASTSSSGAESVASKALTVNLSAASAQDVTVAYAVTGTATGSGTDYTLANGTLTISAGATSGTITIASIVADSLDEANETVIVTLSNPGNATLDSNTVHTYTITDNDSTPEEVVEMPSTASTFAKLVFGLVLVALVVLVLAGLVFGLITRRRG